MTADFWGVNPQSALRVYGLIRDTFPRTNISDWIDADDAPPLTGEWFESADLHRGGTLLRRGRLPVARPKQQISIRPDPDLIEKLRASGPGWLARVNEILRKATACTIRAMAGSGEPTMRKSPRVDRGSMYPFRSPLSSAMFHSGGGVTRRCIANP